MSGDHRKGSLHVAIGTEWIAICHQSTKLVPNNGDAFELFKSLCRIIPEKGMSVRICPSSRQNNHIVRNAKDLEVLDDLASP